MQDLHSHPYPAAPDFLHGKASHEIFSCLMAPYKFRSLATPIQGTE